jgi:hypothetical protein
MPLVIKRYKKEVETGRSKKPDRCSVCHRECALWWHDEYIRKLVTLCGVYEIPIKRLYCPLCKHTFALIPEFIEKFHRYAKDVIEYALKELKKLSHKKVAEKIAIILDTEVYETFIGPATIYNWEKEFGAA